MKCYDIPTTNETLSWQSSVDACAARNMSLFLSESEEEIDFLDPILLLFKNKGD